MTPQAHKQAVQAYARALAHPGDWAAALEALFAPDATIHVVHPFNELVGPDAYGVQFLDGLQGAFQGLYRRGDILIGGRSRGEDWITCHGHYAGKFAASWLGITPTNQLEFVRFAEFFRFEAGRVAEAYVFLDIPNLMIAAGQWPIVDSPGNARGYTGYLPGPASADGIVLHDNDAGETAQTLQIIEDMLRSLATKNEAWRPYWHDNMVWYGPAAFGAFVGIEDFAAFQVPFEGAFELWSGGLSGNGVTEHRTRFADGLYGCIAGWPSLMCVRKEAFLDQPAGGETVFMRVCDFWRREGDLLVENWVHVDIPDVLLQMGLDLFEGHHDVPAGPRA